MWIMVHSDKYYFNINLLYFVFRKMRLNHQHQLQPNKKSKMNIQIGQTATETQHLEL